jgi:hypothetical protein
MRSRILSRWLALAAFLPAVATGQPNKHPTHALIACGDSPTPGALPADRKCGVLVHKQFDALPAGPLVLRLETFPTEDAAQRAGAPASAVVRADRKFWLVSLSAKGQRSRGGRFVTEIGPVPALAHASRYEMLISEATFGPDMAAAVANAVHTHSGPEFWYLFKGEQCLETPSGIRRARAGQGMLEPAETPMQLNIGNRLKRDALFVIVHDAARPATTVSDWRPTGSCQR